MAESWIISEALAALLPPVTLSGGFFAFSGYYRDAVDGYLDNIESELISISESSDAALSGENVREWSRALYGAHFYRNIQRKTFQLTLAGALSWILSYVSSMSLSLGILGFLFAQPPTGLPTTTGLRYLAVLSWGLAVGFSAIIVKRFGFRPEEEASLSAADIESETA